MSKAKASIVYGYGSQLNLLLKLFPNKFYSYEELIILDSTLPSNSNVKITGKVILSSIFELQARDLSRRVFALAFGNHFGYERVSIGDRLISLGLSTLSLHHFSSHTLSSSIDIGTIIMPNAVIMPGSILDKFTIVNTNATIDHDCIVGKGCHIMGSAYIAGRVKIEDYVTVGSNATILPDLRIGYNSVVGAGAVVTRDVPENTVVVGNPAKFLRANRELTFLPSL